MLVVINSLRTNALEFVTKA